jgi:hypothetical protein
MRLQEKDARYLYEWADQWILRGENKVLVKGTPVIVFGSYNFIRQNFGCSYSKNQKQWILHEMRWKIKPNDF